MAAHFPIRAVEAHELDAFRRSNEHAFLDGPPTEQHRAEMLDRIEFDRTLAAFDGTTPVPGRSVVSRPSIRAPARPRPALSRMSW